MTSSPIGITGVHHIAILVSDYACSKDFYTRIMGLEIITETYREARDSWKLDLGIPGGGCIELFSFPGPPKRLSYPEACGLRHLAFVVDDLDHALSHLETNDVTVEPIRTDETTGRRFTFFHDPDNLPIELYETQRHNHS